MAAPHPGSSPLCPRQLGSLAQLPELPLTAMFGCGPTGTSVPSQSVGLWADGREGRKMLLLGSPSPSRCHPPTLLPPPPESLGWPSRRNRQTFKDGLGTLFQKRGREGLALKAGRAWGGGDAATMPQREGPEHQSQSCCHAGDPGCVAAVPSTPSAAHTQPVSPALFCARMDPAPPGGLLAPTPGQTGLGPWTISCAQRRARGARE